VSEALHLPVRDPPAELIIGVVAAGETRTPIRARGGPRRLTAAAAPSRWAHAPGHPPRPTARHGGPTWP